MAHIRPFRGWRYNQDVIQDIHMKFSPLFDVVNPEELQKLYSIPNNSIHLSVPQSLEDAHSRTIEWKQNGIIRQDALPAIYIYYQHFSLYGESREFVRKGFICMVRMEEGTGSPEPGIIPHENTIESSVRDRTEVLGATLLNIAPTHGLYEDPENALEQLMDSYMEHPVYEHIDYQGVVNKLAIVQNKADIDRFMETLKGKPIYMADGHHRYASSRALQEIYRKENRLSPRDSMVNYHQIYVTNLHGSDITILPIHRVLTLNTPPGTPRDLARRFEPWFQIEDVTRIRLPLYEQLRDRPRSFGMVNGDNQFILTLRDDIDPVRNNPTEIPDPVKRLEYTILHYFVFDRIFGIPWDKQTGRDNIRYVKDYSRAVRTATENPKAVSFITRALSLQDMIAVCNAGSLMPQKSTYFYPKVICGLVFASIDENENDSPFDAMFRLPEETGTAG